MISDLHDIPDSTVFDADVCIVGSGAAGLALARELLDTPLRVVILESGGWDQEPATQQLYDGPITGMPFGTSLTGRFRVLGGSTTQWGGQALTLYDNDFKPRDWVNESGWPIGRAQLDPYYPRAQAFMLVDELD